MQVAKYINKELFMDMSKSYILKFLITRLRDALIVGLIISITIFIFFGENISIQYVFGLLLGIFNFVLMTKGLDLIISLRPMSARIMHFLFFTFRYIAITLVIVLFIQHRNANAFVVVGGLLTMNVSIFIMETKKHLLSRKEG